MNAIHAALLDHVRVTEDDAVQSAALGFRHRVLTNAIDGPHKHLGAALEPTSHAMRARSFP